MLTENALTIEKAGVLTSVQDLGRIGYMSYGVARSGAMDINSAFLANWLVGNTPEAAVLETIMYGLSVLFESNTQIAITGGDLGAQINGRSIERYQTINVNTGDQLKFTKRQSGMVAYLAVAGGLIVEHVLGSASTNTIVDLGLASIKNGVQLHFKNHQNALEVRSVPQKLIPVYTTHFTARITPGPELELFDDQFRHQLGAHSFGISKDSNRMGYRLLGIEDLKNLPKGMVSGGMIPGTIQVPSSGQPIILMNDGPTTGGYPRIANVIAQDLGMVAQLGPGDTLRFKWTSFKGAERLYRNRKEVLKSFQ